jgi:hypothetical protein
MGRIKDFRAIATRYDKTARDFLAGICLAAVLIWWISWVQTQGPPLWAVEVPICNLSCPEVSLNAKLICQST